MNLKEQLIADIQEIGGETLSAAELAEALILKGWRVSSDTTFPDVVNVESAKPYREGDYVEVLRNGDWLPGKISLLSVAQNTANVDTERGPVTVYLTGARIRRIKKEESV